MGRPQRFERKALIITNDNGIPPDVAEAAGENARIPRGFVNGPRLGRRNAQDIARLVLTEPERVVRHVIAAAVGNERNADIASQRHLRDRDQKPAVRDVVDGGDLSLPDQAADEIAGTPFFKQVDRRRRALQRARDDLLIE